MAVPGIRAGWVHESTAATTYLKLYVEFAQLVDLAVRPKSSLQWTVCSNR